MIAIIGIGSPHGDDQLGWLAIDRLRASLKANVALHKVRGGIELLECLDGQDAAILIDAAPPSGRPGTIRTFAWPCPDIATVRPISSHGLSLVEALQLAETLGRIPKKVFICTIEAAAIAPSNLPSPEVIAQLNTLLAALRPRLPLPNGPAVE